MMGDVVQKLRGVFRESRFLRNWSLLVVANVLGQVLGMLATIRIARELAPEGYGYYNIVLTVGSIGTVLAALGMRNVVTRECARYPERSGEIFLASLSVQAAMMLLVGAGVFVYGSVGERALSFVLASAAVGVVVGQTSWELLEALTFGHQRMELFARTFLLSMLLWVVGVWVVPSSWLTFTSVSLAFAALQVVKSVAFGSVVHREGYLAFRMPWHAWKRTILALLKQSLPFYWLAILTAATNLVPILFLAERSGEAEVGLYNLGFRLVNPLHLVVWNALLALYPDLSRSGLRDKERFSRIVRRTLIMVMALGTAGALVISLVRWEIVTMLFGAAYLPSADAMAFQVWFSVLYSLYCLMGVTMAAADKQVWMAWLATAYAAIAVPLQWWGAGYGATGLAVAVVAGAVVSLWYHWIAFQRSLPRALPLSFTLELAGILVLGAGVAAAIPGHVHVAWRLTFALILLALCARWLVRQRTRAAGVAEPQRAAV